MMPDLLSQSGLSLDRLQSFCLVAEAGGVTKAAKGDAARQSQFSRQLKELEAFFGVELARRSGRGITLTEAGRRLHTLAREHFAALSDFKQGCANAPVQLTVAAGDSLIQWVLLPQLAGLQARLPDVGLRVLNLPTSEISSGLTEGLVDLGLLRADGVPAGAESVALGSLRFGLFVPARLLPGGKSVALTAKEISRLPLATLEGEGAFRQALQRLARRAKVRPDVRLEVSSFPLVARAVREGVLAGVLPDVARTEFAGTGVVEVKLAWLKPLNRPVALAWNPRLAAIRPVLAKAIPVFTGRCQIEGG
jgi:DNA-binding transcriptional LysR family regulator